jgi:hypothetical protein
MISKIGTAYGVCAYYSHLKFYNVTNIAQFLA